MKYLALEIQGLGGGAPTRIDNFPFLKYSGANATIGAILSDAFTMVIYISLFLAFYWLVWGAFQYIMAGGKKEELAKARARITWAIVGLIIILLSYSVTQFSASMFAKLPIKGGLPF